MKKFKSSFPGLIASLLITFYTGQAAAAFNIAQRPLFLAAQTQANVMVMLDNSGSMKIRMYSGSFDPNSNYSGIFDKDKNYTYDATIPVNTGAYDGDDTDGHNNGYVVTVDSSATGAFIESVCTPAVGDTTCWSGNFLNWATTRRIDASRDVLVGGKLESRNPYNYGTNLNYKIVANNERSDGNITVSSANSDTYSPIPNSQNISVDSPAENGGFQTAYVPYAKLSTSINSPIYDSSNNVIGEFNTITVKDSYSTITLNKSYTSAIVVAKTPSFSGSDPIAIRIKDVTNNSFKIKTQEWKYRDGNHINEEISYIVLEKGEHELYGGLVVKAGEINTDQEYVNGNCGSSRTGSINVPFPTIKSFSSAPIVITSTTTENGSDTVTSRAWGITTSGFTLALQEEENESGHAIETIDYIAIEPGTVNDTTKNFLLEAGKISGVTDSNSTINYSSSFSAAPAFIAGIQTKNDNDTATLRLNTNSSSSSTLHIEEEKSCDNEVTHPSEDVGYIALEGGVSSLNLALVVKDQPTGILHDVDDDVRLGISFYRYELGDGDIYNGVTTDGGTLRFKIPLNPFVKKPTESDTTKLPATQKGYRELDGYIGTSLEQLVDAVEHYPLIWGTTPIAENLYELIQYYKQSSPYYPAINDNGSSFTSFELADSTYHPERDPFYVPTYATTLQCVKNKVLLVTDGEPYKDAAIPAEVHAYDPDSHANDFRDETDPDELLGQDNLDDVAFWAFCNKSGTNLCGKSASGVTPVISKVTENDPATGQPWSNLRDLRTESGMDGNQYLSIDTIGFAGNSIRQVLQDTADNAGGKAYAASDGEALKTALVEAFANAAQTTSFSSVAANSTRLDTNTLIYQASFDSGVWSGQLQAFGLQPNGDINTSPAWHTDSPSTFASPASRKIFTYKPPVTVTVTPSGSGVEFKTLTDLNSTQQTQLTQNQIDYLRGDNSNEISNGGSLRDRPVVTTHPVSGATLSTPHTKVLGDIINSNPWYAGPDNFGYSALGTEGSSYAAHVTAKLSKPRLVIIGANDGMLHAFDANSGVEKFAYVPSTVIPSLSKITDSNYGNSIAHEYFVDGSPRAGDAYFGSAWHTVLVGTTGAGGRGIFALDITDPDNFDENDVLWEFNSDNDPDIGVTMSEPTIVRMANDKWAVIVGNGYNSASGKAVLYILDIEDGSIIKKIDTGSGNTTTEQNGLSSHIPVDLDGDRIVDTIYAGDLLGQLWKFDVTGNSTSNWKSPFKTGSTPEPLFTATNASGTPQPITAKPQVGRHPEGGVMVYFGTGKYFETGDNVIGATPLVHSYYGLYDNNYSSGTTPINRSDLQVQTIDGEASLSGFGIRVTSDNTVNYTDNSDPSGNPIMKGWYMDLLSPAPVGAQGERVISASILRGNRIVFSTLLPNTNPCESGGSSWLMELDGITGARLDDIAFDLNGDGLFTDIDLAQFLDTNGDGVIDANDKVVISGKESTVGITKTPTVIETGDKEYKYASGSSGGLEKTTESSGEKLGRQSWRQLR